MEFDLDATRAAYDPWDLVLKIDGERHPVREITVEEFAKILADGPAPGSEAELAIVAGLFPHTNPPVAAWGQTLRDEVTTAVSTYLAAYVEKKRQRIREAVVARVRGTGVNGSTSTSSSPR